MPPIITQPGPKAQPEPYSEPHPDTAARHRTDLLARATAEDMESALAFLSMIDPEAFEIAFTALRARAARVSKDTATQQTATQQTTDQEDEEPVPVCRQCGAPVGIFLAHGLQWQHFRGDATTSGTQQIYHPGHPAEPHWLLPTDDPDNP